MNVISFDFKSQKTGLEFEKNDEKLRTSLTGIEMPPNPKTGFVLCLGSDREIYGPM
jgi:ribosomal protein S2